MKNYDELTNDLLERRDRYVAEQRQKRKVFLRIATPVCCACAIMLLGLGLRNKGVFDRPPTDNQDKLAGASSAILSTESNNNSNGTVFSDGNDIAPDNAPIEVAFVVNRSDGMLTAAMPDFSIISDYCETKTLEDINQYLGYDVTKLTNVMPDGFRFVGNREVRFYYKNDGSLVHDHCYLCYANGEQWITIGVSKIGAPYDCIFMIDNPTPTVINGVEIIIGAYYADENSDNYDLVFADFSCNDKYYRVTVSNMPTSGENDGISCMINILSELTK